MRLVYFVIFIAFVVNTYFSVTNASDLINKDQGRFVFLPLPFYSPSTGTVVAIKMLHTNLGDTFFADLNTFFTFDGQYGNYINLGQKNLSFTPRLFWNISFQNKKLFKDYWGVGNNLPEDELAQYRYKSQQIKARLGIYLIRQIRLYTSAFFRSDKAYQFDSTDGNYDAFWAQVSPKEDDQYGVTFGVEIYLFDSTIRPKSGLLIDYELGLVSRSLFNNIQSYRFHKAKASLYLPISSNVSHGINASFNSISCSVPFFRYPEILVRGISDTRHNNCVSVVLKNETRIYASTNWVFAPFVDMGKVIQSSKESFTDDLHFGYGVGLRYIHKEALVVLVDFGMSRGGEFSVALNYGHSF
ncbi:MAG: hypothetical protein ISR65_12395 [Bacteriovoracaceae bacterium]|nr:hypothetical protein [Bacteriovoracaceae bacterium]